MILRRQGGGSGDVYEHTLRKLTTMPTKIALCFRICIPLIRKFNIDIIYTKTYKIKRNLKDA